MLHEHIRSIALMKARDLKVEYGLTTHALWMFVTKIEEDLKNYVDGLDRVMRALAVQPTGEQCSQQ